MFWLLACAPTRDCGVELWWLGEAGAVSVIGDWNGWNAEADPLEEVDGAWRIRLDLPAGDYAYLFRVDGVDEVDPLQPLLDFDPITEEERSLLRVDDCAEPALELVSVEVDPLVVELRFLQAEAPLASVRATLDDGTPLGTSSGWAGEIEVWGELPAGKSTVLVEADDGAHTASLRLPLWREEVAFDWQDAVIYQVLVDRFADADGALDWSPDRIAQRLGGDFDGLRAALEAGYFEELGVNVLWLSPVQQNAEGTWPGNDGHDYSGYHGYWPVSPTGIEPAFGGAAALEALVDAAHARGLRVILDIVPNHVHEQHPYRAEADWFHEDGCVCGSEGCPWGAEIGTCWFTDYLPDLAWENPEVAAAVVADTLALVEATDVDGVRVDAVPMLRRHAVRELVWAFSRQLEQGPTDFYTLGETYTGSDGQADIRMNLGPFGLDGQFDFPTLWALRDWLAGGDAAELAATIEAGEAAWEGSGSVMAPILGNHDTSRFVSAMAGDGDADPWAAPPAQPTDRLPYVKLRLAQLVQLSLPGAPVLYQGDEVGLAGADDPDNRRPLPPESELGAEQLAVREQWKTLAAARACLPALRRGLRQTLSADGPVFAHRRGEGDEAAIVVVNAGEAAVELDLGVDGDFVDVLGGAWSRPLRLEAWSGHLFVPAASGCGGAS